MAHLRLIDRGGITFGMDIKRSTGVFRRMMNNTFTAEVKLYEHAIPKKMRCVHSSDLASVMEGIGWIVRDYCEYRTMQIDDGKIYYIHYGEREAGR